MIIRTSLIQRRNDVLGGEFTHHFRDIQGPLGAKVPHILAHVQNHRVRRRDLPSATFLDHVDAYIQTWFPDVHSMIEATRSAEQQLADEDLTNISQASLVTIQSAGPLLGHRRQGLTKLTVVLVGDADLAPRAENDLFRFLTVHLNGDFQLRVNRVLDSPYASPTSHPFAAFIELRLQNDGLLPGLLNAGLWANMGGLTPALAMIVNETVFKGGELALGANTLPTEVANPSDQC